MIAARLSGKVQPDVTLCVNKSCPPSNPQAAAWLPGSRSFYTGGLDRKIIQWDLSGNEIGQWRSPRINDLAVCAGGSRLVSICAEKKIRLCTLAEGANRVTQKHSPVS